MKSYLNDKFHDLKTHPRKSVRVSAGILLVIGGIFGALPVVGFWMLPLGAILLSVDFPLVRRANARLRELWTRLRATL